MLKPPQSGEGADVAAPLYARSGAAAYGVTAEQFTAILDEILRKYRSQSSAKSSVQSPAQSPARASAEHEAAFCAGLRLEELALARACAAGNERAWQDFISRYRQKLHSMALHILSLIHI